VGDGAVVGAGSVVTKDLAAYSIAVGNPARLVRKRFEDDVVDRLVQLKWWDIEDAKLKDIVGAFQVTPLTLETLKVLESLKNEGI
jgi:carbonic anhydrase/acetyltransferase-like protein (isoleucine patch superfamily)